jgi:hypothetical protein
MQTRSPAMTRQLTKDAARYFAKDAYHLSLHNGITVTENKTGQYGLLFISRSFTDAAKFYQIEQAETDIVFNIRVAKSWLY